MKIITSVTAVFTVLALICASAAEAQPNKVRSGKYKGSYGTTYNGYAGTSETYQHITTTNYRTGQTSTWTVGASNNVMYQRFSTTPSTAAERMVNRVSESISEARYNSMWKGGKQKR